MNLLLRFTVWRLLDLPRSVVLMITTRTNITILLPPFLPPSWPPSPFGLCQTWTRMCKKKIQLSSLCVHLYLIFIIILINIQRLPYPFFFIYLLIPPASRNPSQSVAAKLEQFIMDRFQALGSPNWMKYMALLIILLLLLLLLSLF